MKRFIFLITLISSCSFSGTAQTEETLTLSLEQAIKKGLEQRFDHKADQYNMGLAENQINKSKKAWIPNLHAEGNVRYNTELKPTVVPDDFADILGSHILSLGSKSTTTLGLSLEQPIFKPGINTDVKIAKTKRDEEQEKIRGNSIDIKEQIARSYFNVLLKRLQYQIAQKEEQRYEKYKSLVQGKYKNGVLIKNVLLRAQLDYKNAQIKTQKLAQNYKLSITQLKHQINLSDNQKIRLSDNIHQLSLKHPAFSAKGGSVQRTEIKQLELRQKTQQLQLKRARQNALPSLAVVGYYAQLYQNENFHLNHSKWWAPQSYIGLKLSIPITENFTNKNKIHQQKIKQNQLTMTLRQQKTDVHYQIQKATTELHNTKSNMQSAKANYELSQHLYKNQKKQFKIGVFQYRTLLDMEKSLHRAATNYSKAVYQYLNAELAFKKAEGNW